MKRIASLPENKKFKSYIDKQLNIRYLVDSYNHTLYHVVETPILLYTHFII